MFRFVKQIFVSTMMFFGCNLSSINPLECVSMNNQKCKLRPEIVNANSYEPLFYLFSIKKKVNVGVVETILMIPMQNCVFLMFLRTLRLKFLI